MTWIVVCEPGSDRYPLVCMEQVAGRMDEARLAEGLEPLERAGVFEDRGEAMAEMRRISAARRERRRREGRR